MSGKLQSQAIAAPGFKGLNSQDASTDLPEGFALTATNCVIDKYGRIGSRKGLIPVGGQDLTKITYVGEVRGQTIAASNTSFLVNGVAKHVSVNGHVTQGAVIAKEQDGPSFLVMVSELSVPLTFDGTDVVPLVFTSYPVGFAVDTFKPSIILSAFGRLWAAGPKGGSTVYFCDTLNPGNWATGTAGKLDLTTVVGEDVIMGITAHNNSLIIFLRNNILIYSGPSNPAGLALTDTINGLGCIARKSIQRTGEDIIFLSRTGLRSLNRTIQEKSAPLNDLSKNVRDELMKAALEASEETITSVYNPENSFYLLSIPQAFVTYCFDTRISGQWRATTWTITPSAMLSTEGGEVIFGTNTGLQKYSGVNDNGVSFRMTYATSWITAGQPTTVKILKKMSSVVVGGAGSTIIIKTAWDYKPYSQAHKIVVTKYPLSLFGQALFGKATYARGPVIDNSTINVGGAGRALQLILETEIYSAPISIQSLGLYMKVGKSL
jgi:hypothetical protein